MSVIELVGLRKEYRRARGHSVVAIDGLDLSVPEGGVYGFLGPNGSGKTTTIRCLLGLARPSSGACRVLGTDSPAGLPGVIRHIGSLVETPGLFPAMSGRRNLALLGRTHGIGASAVEAVLERFSVASIGRNTAAALGIGFAYFLVVENVVGSFLAGLRRWLVLGNAIVLVSGENSGGDVPGRSVLASAFYLTAVAGALMVGAVVRFLRRDVA